MPANVKKPIGILLLGAIVVLSAACSGEATPTRIARAPTDAPTQTPWIIYIPITTTPEPFTATALPTTTPVKPPATATRTRAPATPRPANTEPPPGPPPTTAPAEPPTAAPPTAPPAASCGQPYSVQQLLFPENGTKRQAKGGSGAGRTIQFQWEPISNSELDPKLGYRINISTPANRQAVYISHNAYLQRKVAILSQQATYGLTLGDDTTAQWNVDVIMTSGEFPNSGDDTTPPLGTITPCGPTSPTFTIDLEVLE